jgi:ubiquinone/menaquinone biosynthesis C-methylase UbiE
MSEQPIRFEDGAGYERMMGTWSRLVGEDFLRWLAPPPGLRWLDVGCGNGAFTEMLAQRCAPAELTGVDPSEAQLAFARQRPGTAGARYLQGDAMALPVPDQAFDAAVMALVIFFVPEPQRGVAEMLRAVRPGGLVVAYAWDFGAGGFPLAALQQEMAALGVPPHYPPSVEVSQPDRLRALWEGAGLLDVAMTGLPVQRRFDTFEDLWATSLLGSSVGPRVAAMTELQRGELQERLRRRMKPDADGRITCSAFANGIRGRAP